MTPCPEEIDFVVTWVDGSDPVWLREKTEYLGREAGGGIAPIDAGNMRYQDHGLLRYWFRGVEKFAPWVRRIHFVTCGHLPPWLDAGHPKLHVVRHGDYMPEEFLPTFNSNAIEMGLHRIEGLAERFVYFNDDMFLLRCVGASYFFRDGMPRDMLAFQPLLVHAAYPAEIRSFLNNSIICARHFDKRENIKKQPGRYFHAGYPPFRLAYNLLELTFRSYTGFYNAHGPAPFLKRTFRDLWEAEGRVLAETESHRFRSKDDVTIYLFRDWQKLSGNFSPCNTSRDFAYFEFPENDPGLCRTIEGRKKKAICVNNADTGPSFDPIREELQAAFDAILPERSAFEADG